MSVAAGAQTDRRTAQFREIFHEHIGYVTQAARRMGVPERDLEDVAHEIFVRVHAQLDTYDGSRPVRPWLFGFAYRVASDHLRLVRHSREVLGEVPDEAPDSSPGPDQRLGQEAQRQLVLAALERVPLERRPVLIMHEIDGCTITEVAQVLEIPVNTAYSRLRVAREEFKRAVMRLKLKEGAG